MSTFHEEVNPDQGARRVKKERLNFPVPPEPPLHQQPQSSTALANKLVKQFSANSVRRARTSILNKVNARSRVIARQRVEPVQQQQQQPIIGQHTNRGHGSIRFASATSTISSARNNVPKRLRRVNFSKVPLVVPVQQQSAAAPNVDGGDGVQPTTIHGRSEGVDEQSFVDVYNVSTMPLQIVEESASLPNDVRPRRKAAEHCLFRLQQHVKNRRPKMIDESAQLDNTPTTSQPQSDNAPTTSQPQSDNAPTVSPPQSDNEPIGTPAQLDSEPTQKTGKQLRQARKNINRKSRVLISVDSDVPNKVQPIFVEDRRKYSMHSVLAVFTIPSADATMDKKGYFIRWRGFDGQNSWVLSADAFCLELACAFTVKSTVNCVLDAMLGDEIPRHVVDELQNTEKWARVKRIYNLPDLKESAFDIAWAPEITPQDRRKAISLLPEFIKIMEEAPLPTTNDEEEEEE